MAQTHGIRMTEIELILDLFSVFLLQSMNIN